MKKLILIAVISLSLAGCKHTDGVDDAPGVVAVKVPNLPEALDRKVERLPDLTDLTMGGQVRSGIEADRAFNDVGFRYNKLIDLYNCVQDAVNNKKDPDKCLSN